MICTFYSYKGGVGRSMALANVADVHPNAPHNIENALAAPRAGAVLAVPPAAAASALEAATLT